jgi:hypothetical protein
MLRDVPMAEELTQDDWEMTARSPFCGIRAAKLAFNWTRGSSTVSSFVASCHRAALTQTTGRAILLERSIGRHSSSKLPGDHGGDTVALAIPSAPPIQLCQRRSRPKDGAHSLLLIRTAPMHCEAALRHYTITGTREGNRTYFEHNKGRRWMMIEEGARTTLMPRDVGGPKR